MSSSPWNHTRSEGVADDIDFEIKGQELQFLEIELDPGESAVAEAGAMVWKDAAVTMSTVFGDGRGAEGGFMGKLLGAGKRLVTGESLFTTVFTHRGQGKARVAFSAPVVVSQRSCELTKKASGLYFSTLPCNPTFLIVDWAGPCKFSKLYSNLGLVETRSWSTEIGRAHV